MDSKQVGRYWEGNAEHWTKQVRDGLDVYRDALNTPAFLEILPDVSGMTGLDLGCGEGTNTQAIARQGARMFGIDIAPTFIRHAIESDQKARLGIHYAIADGEKLPFASNHFDFVTAFMSLMDMPDQTLVLQEVFRILKTGGFLQFSILHPCFVPTGRRNLRDEKGDTYAIEITNYFDRNSGQIEKWHFSTIPASERANIPPFHVPRFHRTLSDWVNMICATGLIIEAFGEPRASKEAAQREPTVADTRIAPIFLHIRARKPE